MKFFMAMDPPTVTYQEKQIAVRNGKPIVYDKPEVVQARATLRGRRPTHHPMLLPKRQARGWRVPDY